MVSGMMVCLLPDVDFMLLIRVWTVTD